MPSGHLRLRPRSRLWLAATGVEGIAQLGVPTTPSGGLTPNRAGDLTTLVWDNPCDVIPTSTYAAIAGGAGYQRLESGGAAIITDATAPVSPSDVWRTRFGAALGGGTAPVSLEGWGNSNYSAPTQYNAIYLTFWIKIGDPINGFQLHNTVQKMGFLGYGNAIAGGARNEGFLKLKGSGNTTSDPASIVSTVQWGFEQQGPSPVNRSINGNSNAIVDCGAWHQVELEARANSAADVADGILKLWVSNALAINKADMVWKTTGHTLGFYWWKWNPTYGGGTGTGNTRSQADDILHDHMLIYAA